MLFSPPGRAVIFDMDGVLLDTEKFYTQVTQEIVGRWGKTFDWSIKAEMVGRPAIESARHLVQALDLPIAPEEYIREREQKLAVYMRDAEPMPGAAELTAALTKRGIPIAVATSSSSSFFAVKTTNHHAWFETFGAIVVGDDERVRRGKPAPDIFLAAASDLGVPAAECIVVEDSPAGVDGALAAGMRALAVPYPGMDANKLGHADVLVTSLTGVGAEDLVGS